jgi:ATP-dependent Zn protease
MPTSCHEKVAIHEAAHAVIARVLTLSAGHVTIKPNYRDRSRGVSITHEPYACLSAWEKRGKVRNSDNAVYIARIISTMAGAEAEMEFLGSAAIGDGQDRQQIEIMAEELTSKRSWSDLEPRLRKMTRMLVRRHRARIERVAEALLAKTKLHGKQVDRLAGRSVDDVKVNAPFLLAMRRASAAVICNKRNIAGRRSSDLRSERPEPACRCG